MKEAHDPDRRPLYRACMERDLPMVQWLVENGAREDLNRPYHGINHVDGGDGQKQLTPLFLATARLARDSARRGVEPESNDLVEYLIKAGATIEVEAGKGVFWDLEEPSQAESQRALERLRMHYTEVNAGKAWAGGWLDHFLDRLDLIGPLRVTDRDKLCIIDIARKEVLKEEAWMAFALGVFSSRNDRNHRLHIMYANGKDSMREIRQFLHAGTHIPWIRSMRQIVAHAPAVECRILRNKNQGSKSGLAFGGDHPRNSDDEEESSDYEEESSDYEEEDSWY